MDFASENYHWLNVTLLSVLGLWPYGNKFFLRLKRFVSLFFSAFGCFAQLATLYTVDYTRTLFLKNAPGIFVACGMFFKNIWFLFASDTIKEITETINEDWKNMSNKGEVRIIQKYAEKSKFYTKSFAMLIWSTVVCLIILPLSPLVLDIVTPLNETRSRTIPLMFETFFDQRRYFLVTACLFEGWIVVGGVTFVATETLFIIYIHHACVLFEATSRRMKTLLYSTAATKSQTISNDAIAPVVDIHSGAIRYCKKIRNAFYLSYLILMAFGILSLGAHLFRCTQTFTTREYSEFLASALFSFSILGYMSFLMLVMQSLIDSSVNIFNVLCNSDWYTFPISSRKFVHFCMVHTFKPVTLDICGIFFPSYEGFCLILRLTMTYVTALFSLQ